MSVLEGPSRSSALPHTTGFAPGYLSTGNIWGPGPSENPFAESPTAAEALSLSLLLAIQPEWTTESRDIAQLEQSQRVVAGRKRKMSSREDPRQDQPPKHPRRTESLDPPQYVAPYELTASSGHTHSYPPTSESPDLRSMRHASTTPVYEHARPMEARQPYNPSQYLHPHEAEWSTSVQRSERPALPSLSPRPETRVTGSYSMPPATTSYAPAMSQMAYQRSSWYDGSQPQQHQHSFNQPTVISGMEQLQRTPQAQAQAQAHGQAQAEADSRPKPRCWEHGCNGREFSTFSNLLRHQRERAGVAQKVSCPRCGAEFTRKTARDGHVAHAKCKPIRRSPDPGKGSNGGHRGSGSQSSHRSSHGHIY